MSKAKTGDQAGIDSADPAGENTAANNPDVGSNGAPPEENLQNNGGNNTPPDEPAELLPIEEHREKLNIDAPVFAAVMQAQGWGAGKRIPEAEFEEAVEAFLKAPMGGKK